MRWAHSLASNADAARDAVQEAFLRYFIERRYGRSIQKPRAWLYVVARNYLSRHGAAAAREISSEALERVPVEGSDPEKLAQRAELSRQAFARLTGRETACVRLRVEGRDYTEIGELMRIRPGTVGALLARAQSKIRALAVSGGARPATVPPSCG